MVAVRWTEEQTKKALFLYFQLSFGQLHQGNPEIVALAKKLGRSPSSVAMKLANFASLDPKILASGRKGLSGASALDKEIWDWSNKNWTKFIIECTTGEDLSEDATNNYNGFQDKKATFNYFPPDGLSSKKAYSEQRLGQSFFRRAVLSNFENTCCVTGVDEPKILVASHISSWASDIENRHNPRNGLCLSATFDRAFDAYLMTVTPDLEIRISTKLICSENVNTKNYFSKYEGKLINMPTHISPDPDLLAIHSTIALEQAF